MTKSKKISNLENQVEILYNQSSRVLIGYIVIAVVSGFVLWNKLNNFWLVTWVAAMIFWSAGRAVLIYSFYRTKEKKKYHLWGQYFAITSALAGLILGSIIYLTPSGFSFELAYLYIIFVGMIAGSVSSTSSYPPAMFSFFFSLYGIVSIRMITSSFKNPRDSFITGLTFLFVIVSPILLQFGKSINKWIQQIYDMYIEKESLARSLEIEKERLRLSDTVLKNVKEGVIITNSKKHIIYTNPAFTEISGYDHDKVVGKELGIFFSNPNDLDHFKKISQELEIGGIWNGEVWTQRPNGESYPVLLNMVTLSDNTGCITNYIAHFRDITNQKREEEKLKYYANFDPLTGLPNRKAINDHLDSVLINFPLESRRGALLFLDLNFFKEINDQYGHRIGDALLQDVAQRLKDTLCNSGLVGRLGGDEFVVVLWDKNYSAVQSVAEELVECMKRPFSVQDKECTLTLSIGIAFIPEHGTERRALMYRADIAMYEAKRERAIGKWVVYEESFLTNFNNKN